MPSGKNRALIVVDVQNDFCPGGSLAVKDGDKVVEPLNRHIRNFLDASDLVIKSRDWHPKTTKHFAQFGGTWPPHCVQNTYGAKFHPDLIDDPRIIIVSTGLDDSDGYSAFDETELEQILKANDVGEVWIGGLATDYCVKHTVLDALEKGFKVKAIRDAMRAVNLDPDDGEAALREMATAGAEMI
jgi:nicotinamidase/pyrazinamidase